MERETAAGKARDREGESRDMGETGRRHQDTGDRARQRRTEAGQGDGEREK